MGVASGSEFDGERPPGVVGGPPKSVVGVGKDGVPGDWWLESHISEARCGAPDSGVFGFGVAEAPVLVRPERPEGGPEARTPGCSRRRASARAMRSTVPQSMAWMGAEGIEMAGFEMAFESESEL